ncbi:MAG: hydrogenase nickel incorporation protein HypA [Bacillales bacterium]|jgi:hydrogenase nickel incorporation protein HypA/HybF|nr:hydrogenase nickel incorporation protein HypA [Bacillales bacterium]
MHEMALMGDILNLVFDDAKQKKITKVKSITLTVGQLSNALPDALEMAFDINKAQGHDMLSDSSKLNIIIEEAKATCIFCEELYKPTHRIAICPKCNMPGGKLTSGETFKVETYEGE